MACGMERRQGRTRCDRHACNLVDVDLRCWLREVSDGFQTEWNLEPSESRDSCASSGASTSEVRRCSVQPTITRYAFDLCLLIATLRLSYRIKWTKMLSSFSNLAVRSQACLKTAIYCCLDTTEAIESNYILHPAEMTRPCHASFSSFIVSTNADVAPAENARMPR